MDAVYSSGFLNGFIVIFFIFFKIDNGIQSIHYPFWTP